MTPAPSAGGEDKRKKRRRRRPAKPHPQEISTVSGTSEVSQSSIRNPLKSGGDLGGSNPFQITPPAKPRTEVKPNFQKNLRPSERKDANKRNYTKRVDEVSAGGLVVDTTGTKGLLIGRRDLKDQSRERLLWSLPKGHIEEGESPQQAAIREVAEETGIESEISRELGVIDFWFMAGGKRIHKTVHHYLFKEVGGHLAPQITEVDDVAWFPLTEIVGMLAYPDEKKLIAKSENLNP